MSSQDTASVCVSVCVRARTCVGGGVGVKTAIWDDLTSATSAGEYPDILPLRFSYTHRTSPRASAVWGPPGSLGLPPQRH